MLLINRINYNSFKKIIVVLFYIDQQRYRKAQIVIVNCRKYFRC